MKAHNIIRAIFDPRLFKPWFRNPDTWTAWHAFMKALFGLPMNEDDLAVYQQCTGRTEPPAAAAAESLAVLRPSRR